MVDRRHFALGGLTALIGGGAWPASANPTWTWPAGARAAVSLTYDDGLASQLDVAVPQLDQRGLKATFFLTRDNMGDRLDGWRAAHARGHEMADHTISHPCHLGHASPGAYVRREIAPMEAFLDQSFGPARAKLFAYPCDNTELGSGSLMRREARYARLVRQAFVAARTTDGPPNDPAQVGRNRYFLHGFEPTYDHDDPRLALRYLKRAMAERRWAILIFHEILPARRGAGDTSIATHAAILDWIAAQPLWCAPMGEVLGSILDAKPPAQA